MPNETTPYEDGDGTEVARLVRERARTEGYFMRVEDELAQLRDRVAMLEAILTHRNTGL